MRPLEGVKELRERRMLSQQELADRAGVSLFTVQRIEREDGSVRPKTGRAIAAALGVGVEDLLGKAQAPLPEFPEERREAASVVALDAARRQREHDRKAINRTHASEGIPQPSYFAEDENAAIQRLSGYLPTELAPAVMELAQRAVQLEERVVQLEEQLERTSKASSEETKIRSASA